MSIIRKVIFLIIYELPLKSDVQQEQKISHRQQILRYEGQRIFKDPSDVWVVFADENKEK